ncbi:Uncharacterized protein dnm_092890 [Desulfonema magnum]|uniref:Uncharacterized protein n=1 Tax=Desulfonema magnum TaxID=45655 RepID=A0A975GTK8_9BACT|nr:Uncharacterized protein dnm_092890 [Desulfonema magnum]
MIISIVIDAVTSIIKFFLVIPAKAGKMRTRVQLNGNNIKNR